MNKFSEVAHLLYEKLNSTGDTEYIANYLLNEEFNGEKFTKSEIKEVIGLIREIAISQIEQQDGVYSQILKILEYEINSFEKRRIQINDLVRNILSDDEANAIFSFFALVELELDSLRSGINDAQIRAKVIAEAQEAKEEKFIGFLTERDIASHRAKTQIKCVDNFLELLAEVEERMVKSNR